MLAGSLLAVSARAQQVPFRYSVGAGVERMGLDAPDGSGLRCLVGVARHWAHDRVLLLANAGYGWADNRRYLGVNDWYVEGRTRQRFTLDVTAAFDLLKHPRHALRVGAGPCLWYRREERFEGARFTIDSQGQLLLRDVSWSPVAELTYGLNVLTEYELALTPKLLLRVNAKFFDLKKGGQNSLIGGGLAYRLR